MKAPRTQVTIATRGSALALWQADYVASLLKNNGVASEKLILKTTADRVQDRFLHEMGGKGLFVKELEEALVEQRADLAMHSLKDMPAVVKAPFALAAVLKRHSPADAMIFRKDIAATLKPAPVLSAAATKALGKLTVGTGSLRRQAILKREAPELECVGVRGNVDTRLRKLEEGNWDALILAEASLDRLGLKEGRTVSRLDPAWFIPCASQGALALEARADDPLCAWLGTLGDELTTKCVAVERGLLARLGGDCTMPFGGLVAPDPADPGKLIARVGVYSKEGDAALATERVEAKGFEPVVLQDLLAAKLKAAGAARILKALGIDVPREFQ